MEILLLSIHPTHSDSRLVRRLYLLPLATLCSSVFSAVVVDFNADQVLTPRNLLSDFVLNESSATVDSELIPDYTGQAIFGGFKSQGDCLWSAHDTVNAGLKLRWNADAGAEGEQASGLFLFKKAHFLSDLHSGQVVMDAASDSVELSVGWINSGMVGADRAIAAASIRIVVKDNSGYHISAPISVSTPGAMNLEITELGYSSYDPFNNNQPIETGITGAASTPTFTGIRFLGFRLDATRGQDIASGSSFGLTSFRANGKHAPVSMTTNVATRHQRIEGFGAAGAWYETLLHNHNSRAELIDLLFKDLSLDIYRLRNVYNQGTNYPNKIARDATIIELGAASLAAAGQSPLKVLISGWSPPEYLKSNGSTKNGGTLAKDIHGNYRYSDYADWWNDSLIYYASAGTEIIPDYVSIQNEPNWTATHDTNRLGVNESTTEAGYDEALEAVWQKLNSRMGTSMPKMLGPETVGLRLADQYIDQLSKPSQLYGYAHHLYQEDVGQAPDALLSEMAEFYTNYGDKPIFQTEYFNYDSPTPWLRTYNLARLIHNSITVENVSAYLYWGLFWNGDQGLINISDTSNYSITPEYYAFKHYSAFIEQDWQRIDASTSKSGLSVSAFISPSNDQASLVILNPYAHAVTLELSFLGLNVHHAIAHRSSATENCVALGSIDANMPIEIPANSITTLELSVSLGNAAPTVDLISPEEISIPADVGLLLEAQVSDDEKPNTLPPTIQWSILSAPVGASVDFDDPNASTTGATFDLPGEYQLQILADDSEDTSRRSVTVRYAQPDESTEFTSQDIGAVSAVGNASMTGDTLTISGSGGDIWNSADEFHFYHSPLEGDGSLVARVVSQANTNSWAKAGLMIRDSLNANSTHCMIAITPGNGAAFQRRTTTNQNSLNDSAGGYTFPVWLKITRSGSTITAHKSTDGVNWTESGSETIQMTGGDYIGFAVTSHDDGSLSEAVFDHLENHVSNIGASVSAGGDSAHSIAQSATLTGTVVDDGKPTPLGTVTLEWSQLSGTGHLTFTAPTSHSTDAHADSTGEYVVRLIADDGAIKTFDDRQLSIHSILTAWQIDEFGSASAEGAALLEDPNANGLVNLLEFAFGGDPDATNSMGTALLPTYELIEAANENLHLAFTFRRRTGTGTGSTETGYRIDGITYTIETTPTLSPANWQTGSDHIVQVGSPVLHPNGTESVTVQLTQPIDSATRPRSYMRVKVTLDE